MEKRTVPFSLLFYRNICTVSGHYLTVIPIFQPDGKGIKPVFQAGYQRQRKVARVVSKKGERGIWQRRFWEHSLRDEEDFIRHVEYIHYNPVKHGYVSRVKEWSHSSFHHYVRDGSYPLEWAGCSDNETSSFGE